MQLATGTLAMDIEHITFDIGTGPKPVTGNNYTNSRPTKPVGSKDNVACWMCVEFGVHNPNNHGPDECFTNPVSDHYKPEVAKRRIANNARQGRKLSTRY